MPDKERSIYYDHLNRRLHARAMTNNPFFPTRYRLSHDPIVRFIWMSKLEAHARRIQNPEAIALFTPLCKDPDPRIKQRARCAILSLGIELGTPSEELCSLVNETIQNDLPENIIPLLKTLAWRVKEPDRGKYLGVLDNALANSNQEVRLAGVELLGNSLESLDNPLEKIKTVLKDQSSEVKMATASLLSISLPKILGSQTVFDEFSKYPIEENPEIHRCLATLLLCHKDFARSNRPALEHLLAILKKSSDTTAKEWAVWTAAKILPTDHPLLAKVFSLALEDDDPWVRTGAKFWREIHIFFWNYDLRRKRT